MDNYFQEKYTINNTRVKIKDKKYSPMLCKKYGDTNCWSFETNNEDTSFNNFGDMEQELIMIEGIRKYKELTKDVEGSIWKVKSICGKEIKISSGGGVIRKKKRTRRKKRSRKKKTRRKKSRKNK